MDRDVRIDRGRGRSPFRGRGCSDRARSFCAGSASRSIAWATDKQPAEAHRIMMMVHTQGKGLCGVYPFEVAETKVATVVDRARDNGFPLRAAMEPE